MASSRRSVLAFVGQLRELLRGFGPAFSRDSPAGTEARLLADDDAVRGVLGQAAFLYESTSDHVVAVTRILSEPAQSIAPFSLVRAAIEVSSICCWILDPTLAPFERQSRSIAFRRKGLDGQKTLVNENPQIDDGGVAERYAYLDAREKKYGAQRVAMPPATELVAAWFGGRSPYRLTSAVVHGHPWAISQVAFSRNDKESAGGIVFLEPALKPNIVLYLLVLALDALARPVWLRTLYSGHDRDQTSEVLDNAYDAMQILPGRRFWRAG